MGAERGALAPRGQRGLHADPGDPLPRLEPCFPAAQSRRREAARPREPLQRMQVPARRCQAASSASSHHSRAAAGRAAKPLRRTEVQRRSSASPTRSPLRCIENGVSPHLTPVTRPANADEPRLGHAGSSCVSRSMSSWASSNMAGVMCRGAYVFRHMRRRTTRRVFQTRHTKRAQPSRIDMNEPPRCSWPVPASRLRRPFFIADYSKRARPRTGDTTRADLQWTNPVRLLVNKSGFGPPGKKIGHPADQGRSRHDRPAAGTSTS